MRKFRVVLAQMNPAVGDIPGNAAAIRERIDRAESRGADLIAFPELVLTGYPPEDLVLKPSAVELCMKAVETLARDAADGPSFVIGAPVMTRTGLWAIFAWAAPVMRLVAPGPEVATQTPMRPVTREYPSAACAAACFMFRKIPGKTAQPWRLRGYFVSLCADSARLPLHP